MNLRHAWSRTATVLRLIGNARERHAAAYPALVSRFIDVYARRRYSLREIVKLDLLDPRRESAWFDRNTSKENLVRLQRRLNPQSHWVLTEDKNVFYQFCKAVGLATPRVFGCISLPAREHAARVFDRAAASELIVKPVQGVYGRGVVAVRREGGLLIDSSGIRREPAEVLGWLASLCDYETFIVQERVESHESLARLSGTRNVQTARMVTYVRSDGRPIIGGCQLKIIGAGAVADNYAGGRTGNMLGDIPGASGQLSTVHAAASDGGSCLVDRHPRTGIAFRGFEVPLWAEARALVERAALAFLPLRTIGWDVAITPRGPMLIEGNVTWDPPQLGEEISSEILDAINSDESPS